MRTDHRVIVFGLVETLLAPVRLNPESAKVFKQAGRQTIDSFTIRLPYPLNPHCYPMFMLT